MPNHFICPGQTTGDVSMNDEYDEFMSRPSQGGEGEDPSGQAYRRRMERDMREFSELLTRILEHGIPEQVRKLLRSLLIGGVRSGTRLGMGEISQERPVVSAAYRPATEEDVEEVGQDDPETRELNRLLDGLRSYIRLGSSPRGAFKEDREHKLRADLERLCELIEQMQRHGPMPSARESARGGATTRSGETLTRIRHTLELAEEHDLVGKAGAIVRELDFWGGKTRDDLTEEEIAQMQAKLGAPEPLPPPPLSGARLRPVGGPWTARAGDPVNPAVQVVKANGDPYPGVQVTFVVNANQGTVAPPREETTNDQGIAEVQWRLGPRGRHRLTVIAGPLSTTLSATAT
jgi:hypothetical protein